MFEERKLFKKFIDGVKNNIYSSHEVRDLLENMPVKVLRKIAKKIVYADFDGHNESNITNKMCYFDYLNRWQKEVFVRERLYKLL